MMEKRERRVQQAFDYDDQGIMQVSQLISDSYNSGAVGQEPKPTGDRPDENVQ